MSTLSSLEKTALIRKAYSKIRGLAGGARRGIGSAGRGIGGAVKRHPYMSAGGAAAGGIGVGAAGATYGPDMIQDLKTSFGTKRGKGKVRYADSSKNEVIWETFQGGPVLRGPTRTMKSLWRVGRRDRKEGIKMLQTLLKQGTIRKVGTV